MHIRIYCHLTDLPGWLDIANEQLSLIGSSGLLDRSTVYLHQHYDGDYTQLTTAWGAYPQIQTVVSPAVVEDFELGTAALMQTHARESTDLYAALYVHPKGITFLGSFREEATRDWRHLMNYWCIERWRDCVAALDDGWDCAGCNWHTSPWPHFSGNQHWATSDFLRRCSTLRRPSDVGMVSQVPRAISEQSHYRYDFEAWYGANGARAKSLYESGLNHYRKLCPPESYRLPE